jgi:hypothetical protein
MTKSKAKLEALESKRTFGELQLMVEATRGKREKSKVNTSLTLNHVLDMFESWLKTKKINSIPSTTVYNTRKDRIQLGSDGLIVMHILRECGSS